VTCCTETAAHAGVALEWHCGFEIAAADVPADFREPETPAFAREVCDRLEVAGRYDAAVVGRAAASAIRDPDSWAGWGDPEEVRQLVKYLWHVLVAFGVRHSFTGTVANIEILRGLGLPVAGRPRRRPRV